jgi:hypothetical protein
MLHVTAGEKMTSTHDYLLDCHTLPATELRRRYRAEANTHRNMHHRAKTQGRKVHPAFKVFSDFLTHVGPRPCPGATLDRIDNSDLEYAPGKVRWADKRTQNSNKGDSLLFYYSRTGDTYTASRLAKLRKVSPGAIRKRKQRGWTDDEIVERKRHGAQVNADSSPPSSAPREKRPPITSKRAPGLLLCRDVIWERNARYAAWCRETEGQECCLADFDFLRETAAEFGIQLRPEVYEKRFAKWWAEWQPHVIRENLPEWAQNLIAKIEASEAGAACEKFLGELKTTPSITCPEHQITDCGTPSLLEFSCDPGMFINDRTEDGSSVFRARGGLTDDLIFLMPYWVGHLHKVAVRSSLAECGHLKTNATKK